MAEKITTTRPYESSEKDVRDVIAPAALEVNPKYLRLGNKFVKTLFVFTYPRYLSTGWFSPVINLPATLDVSFFTHPVDTVLALRSLRKKSASIEAQIHANEEAGRVRDPMLETALEDVEHLRDQLQQAQERIFNVSVYITLYAETTEELNKLEEEIGSLMESRLIYVKPALFQQLEAFNSVLPLNQDKLAISTPLNSATAGSFFPFISPDLTSTKGILYGINRHNNSLVIFDRFSLENANMVIFAKSGAGKSYTMKLEIIRSMMVGTDVIVIDPENEYETLARAVGGSFFNISLASKSHINPFDIPVVPKGEDPADVLRSHILNIIGLLKVMLGEISKEEDAIIDKAITETYASRDITPDKDFSKAQPPLLDDLQTILENMEAGAGLAQRLYKYTRGAYAGFTNHPTNIDVKNRLIVFSIRDLEEQLRPVAMYVILHFIWNLIRVELKRRILIVDEAWIMMKYEDGATFLFGLVKRARKYYLGITTITQDVEDFLRSPYGRPIITNSSIQILLKQAPAMMETIAKTFNLAEAEKTLLLEAGVGEGLFFAGLKHVAVKIIGSYSEDKIITTNPEEILKRQKEQI